MAFSQALKSLNRGLAAVGLGQLPDIIPGVPGCPDDCPFQRAFRNADPSCKVYKKRIHFKNETVARAVASAWGEPSRGDRLTVVPSAELPYQVLMPRAMRKYIYGFDRIWHVDHIDFGAVTEKKMTDWSGWLSDDRLEVITTAWAAEQGRRAFVGV